MDVITLKMVSGEEIVAELTGESETHVMVERPKVLQVVQTHDGMQMALYPWLMSDPDMREVVIPRSKIIVSTMTNPDIAKNYIQQVSGIQIATTLLG